MEKHQFCRLNNCGSSGRTNLSDCEYRLIETYSCTIFYCIGGSAEFEIGSKIKTVKEDDIIVLPDGFDVILLKKSDDFMLLYTSCAKDICREVFNSISYPELWKFITNNFVVPCPRRFRKSARLWFRQSQWTIKNISYDNNILKNCLYNILSVIFHVLDQQGKLDEYKLDGNFTHMDKIVHDFNVLLCEKFLEYHEVAYYANELGVSPQHLYKLVKQVYGTTPKEMLENRIIAKAKTLLSYTEQSIKQIALYLGYKDDAYLCRVFKSSEGITMVDYRKINKKKRE